MLRYHVPSRAHVYNKCEVDQGEVTLVAFANWYRGMLCETAEIYNRLRRFGSFFL